MGARTGEENKGQQDLDLSLVWSLPRPFSWTSDLYSLFSFSSLYAGPKSKASLGISPTPSCCVDIDPLSKLDHVRPLFKILLMSTHLPPWPSVMGPGLPPTPSLPSASSTRSHWQFSRLLPLLFPPPARCSSFGCAHGWHGHFFQVFTL